MRQLNSFHSQPKRDIPKLNRDHDFNMRQMAMYKSHEIETENKISLFSEFVGFTYCLTRQFRWSTGVGYTARTILNHQT